MLNTARRTVLVTGAAGFIGSHLVDALLAQQYRVVGFDNFSTGKESNLQGAKAEAAFTLVKGDVRAFEAVRAACQGVDAIFHLAAVISPSESVRNPRKYYEVNVTGTLNVVLAGVETGVKRLVFPSSAAVYGPAAEIPIPEEAPPNPTSPYGASKVAGELFCQTMAATHPVETIVLRLFNVYGPRQSNTSGAGVVRTFIHRAQESQPLRIFGDGLQTRDFIYVHDVVEALIRSVQIAQVPETPINIGTGQPVTIVELAELIQQEFPDTGSQVRFEPPRSSDIYHSVAKVDRMQNLLKFKPRYTIRDGLERTCMALRD